MLDRRGESRAAATAGWLWRALGVAPGERHLVFWGAATLFLAGWATVSLANVSETFFLKRVGVAHLPLVFLANSILLAGTTLAVGRLAARTDHQRLLTAMLIGLALTLLPLWALVVGDVRSVFVLLVIVAKQTDSIVLVAFWIVQSDLVHGRQAKRVYAPITAGGTLGAVLGSFASGLIGRLFGAAALMLVAAVALALAAVASLALRRLVPPPLDRVVAPSPAHPPGIRKLWRTGYLVRVLLLSAFFTGVLGPMLYFQFSYVADLATQGAGGEQRLLALYAQLRGWLNLGVMVIQLTGTARLFRILGVPLAAALSPLVYLIGFAGLSVRLGLPAGVGAMVAVGLQDHAVYDPAQRILATLLPERLRSVVTALVDGAVKRTGGAAGNLLVIGALAVGSPAWVGWVGLPIAALWLAAALGLWRVYPTLLLAVVRTRGTLGDEVLPRSAFVDPGTVRVLERALVADDEERARTACELLASAPRGLALGAVARAVGRAGGARRPLLVGTLDRLLADDAPGEPLRYPEVARTLAALLATPETLAEEDRAVLVGAYARLCEAPGADSGAHALLERLAVDASAATRLAAAAALERAGAWPASAPSLDALLADAVASGDPALRRIAGAELRAMLLAAGGPAVADDEERTRWGARLAALTALLADARERAAAAAALAEIAARHGSRVAACGAALVTHTEDPDPAVRAAVARFVGHAGLAQQGRWLVERLSAPDAAEVEAAREALRALGPAALDVVLETLRFGRRSARTALAGVLRAIRVDAATLRTLIERECDAARRMLGRADALAAGSVSGLVLLRLRERVAESMHAALLLLAALLGEDRIAELAQLLALTHDARERAVLLEALEALLPADERAQVMPLLEYPRAPARGEAGAGPSFVEALSTTLADDDELTRGSLLVTLDADTLARARPARERDPKLEERMLRAVEIVLHLRSLDIFERLTTRQLAALANVVREETHAAGSVLVREGELDDCMYLVLAGTVRITKGATTLTEIGPGEFFGEMAVFDGETRSATVTAVGRVRLLRLARQDLFHLMDEQPAIAIEICQTLTRRVRRLTEQVTTGAPWRS